jgi:hypothetical protein
VLVPFGADLRLHTYGLLQGVLAEPLVLWLGVVAGFNVIVVLTLLLNGVTTYALVVREARSAPAAVLAATCCMLASPILAQLRVGRPSFGSVWLVAGAVLAAGSLLDRPHAWKGIALGGLLLGALVSDFQIALFAAIWLIVYGVYRAWRDRGALVSRGHVVAIGLAAALAGLPFLLVYYPALARADAAGYPRPALDDMLPYSFRLVDYADPLVIPHVYGFDLLVGALAASALFRWRGVYRVWLVGGGVCLLLALGPSLQPTELPLPFAALGVWPPLAQFRTPSRLAMPAVFGLSVVLGLAVAPVLRRVTPLVASLAVGLLIAGRLVFALAHDPFGVQTYPTYSVYERLAAEPGRFTLLEVPFGVRSGLARIGDGGEVLEYYQHVHGKPVINGMIARLPTLVFDAYGAHPALRLLSGEDVSASAEDLDEVLRWAEVRYVVVHRGLLTEAQLRRIEGLLDQQLQRVDQEADLVVFAVRS